MRKGLVVLQLFISQSFIIATIVIVKQIDFIQRQDVGFSKEAIITVPIPSQVDTLTSKGEKMRALKNELLMLPGVEKASLNYAPPTFKAAVGATFNVAGNDEEYDTQVKYVDGDYLALYHLQLLAGEQLPDLDRMSGLVVNEKFVKWQGLRATMTLLENKFPSGEKSDPLSGW